MELIDLKRKKTVTGSYYIQQSQLIKFVTNIINKYPYLLVVTKMNKLTLLEQLKKDDLDLDNCFTLLETKDFHHFIYYLFPKLKIKQEKTNITLLMAKINNTHQLGTVYRNRETGQTVIPYATANHVKNGVPTDLQITIFKDAKNPQDMYFSMKSTEFLTEFEQVEL